MVFCFVRNVVKKRSVKGSQSINKNYIVQSMISSSISVNFTLVFISCAKVNVVKAISCDFNKWVFNSKEPFHVIWSLFANQSDSPGIQAQKKQREQSKLR